MTFSFLSYPDGGYYVLHAATLSCIYLSWLIYLRSIRILLSDGSCSIYYRNHVWIAWLQEQGEDTAQHEWRSKLEPQRM